MKFSIALLSTIAVALANNVDVATVLLSDINAHLNDYMSLVGGTIPIPTDLIAYYTKVATYTDDSYTSILSDFPVQQVESVVTQLPWYSSRLESKLAAAFTEDNASVATTSSSAENSSAVPTSSAAPTTPSSSAASKSSSGVESSSSEARSSSNEFRSSSEETSSSASTSAVPSSTESSSSSIEISSYTAGANNLNGLLPLVLASPLLSFLI